VPDPALAGEAVVRLPVQVNGKTRVVVSVLAGTGQQEFERLLLTDPKLTALTRGRTIERIVFVPDRIANIVLR
jgi:leucyl-tRNA synthetase